MSIIVYMNTKLYTRNKSNMSLREFSSALGVSYETARLWKKGRMKPTADRLIEIFTKYDDWRKAWAQKQLEQLYPVVWKALCPPPAPGGDK